MDNNFQIILRSGESIDVSCGPGQGRASTFELQPHEAIVVTCGTSTLYIQCQPGNVKTEFFRALAKNQTLTVSCSR